MPKKKPAKPSAGARIKAAGKSLVWATFDEAEKAKIRGAAGLSGQAMSEFLKFHGLAAAEKILQNFKKSG